MTLDAPQVTADSDLVDATVLVTGGAGFVGAHLVNALAPHAHVRVLDDLTSGDPARVPDDVTLVVGDVTDDARLDDVMQDVGYVFHLAAISTVPDATANPTRAFDVNANATAALLERARDADARLVFASSAAIYGRPTQTPIPETEALTPRSAYGISKLAADQYVRGYADWYDASSVALRFFNVYGPDQDDGVVPSFVERARDGDPLVVHGAGDQTRDFVHVYDVVRAMLAAAGADVSGEAYNVGTGTDVSVRALAERISELADTDVAITHDDPRPADIQESRANVDRARDDLGFEATIDLDTGLRDLLGTPIVVD